MEAAGRSAVKDRQFFLAFLLSLVTAPTKILCICYKLKEKLFRSLESSSLHVKGPLVSSVVGIPV